MKALNLNQLEQDIEAIVAAKGYELVDVAWTRQQGKPTFRVTIDRRAGEGFISHDDCSIVSNELSTWLDVKDALPGNYDLEVSSPGMPRTLKYQRDFQRFIGGKIRVRVQVGLSELSGQRTFTGRLEDATDTTISIMPEGQVKGAKPIEVVTLRLATIEKALLLEHPERMLSF